MKDALDQLLFEVRRERRVAARERREERARNRHKIPDPEPQGKPDRWHPTVIVLILHSSGARIGLFTELHHEVHPEWIRYQPVESQDSPHHTLVVSGSSWFPQSGVERPDSDEETVALRDRLIELLNAQETEHHPSYPPGDDDSGGSEYETEPLPLLPG